MRATDKPRIRALVVDDHELVRDGLAEILTLESDITVVAHAANGADAIAVAREVAPDVVVLDVEMPGEDAITTVRRLLRAVPGVRVLMLSVHDNPMVVRQLFAAGAHGYLLKSVARQDFVSAIRAVYQDRERTVLSISAASMRHLNTPGIGLLSIREREIMALVAQAMSNAQISRRLDITEGTVKRHLRNIFGKLHAVSRIDAVNKAIQSRDLSPPVLAVSGQAGAAALQRRSPGQGGPAADG